MSTQEKIAYNVALLLPQEIKELAVSLNNKLGEDKKIFLDNENFIPHITLVQGIAESSSVSDIGKILSEIASRYQTLELTASRMYNRPKVTEISIERTPLLEKLQAEVFDALAPYTTYDAVPEYFFDKQAIEGLLRHVNAFPFHSKEHYEPHITIGFGKLGEKQDNLPVDFKPVKLALCRLGDYGTCRKILSEYTL